MPSRVSVSLGGGIGGEQRVCDPGCSTSARVGAAARGLRGGLRLGLGLLRGCPAHWGGAGGCLLLAGGCRAGCGCRGGAGRLLSPPPALANTPRTLARLCLMGGRTGAVTAGSPGPHVLLTHQ